MALLRHPVVGSLALTAAVSAVSMLASLAAQELYVRLRVRPTKLKEKSASD